MGTLECRMRPSPQRRSEMPTMPLLLLSRDAWRKILEVDRRWRSGIAGYLHASRRNLQVGRLPSCTPRTARPS